MTKKKHLYSKPDIEVIKTKTEEGFMLDYFSLEGEEQLSKESLISEEDDASEYLKTTNLWDD